MRTLVEAARGHDNNLNIIRMGAAIAVLISHAWPIALGPETVEPLQAVTGHSLGTLAVFVFFAISGFLIAASFDRRQSIATFIQARALRLFPALAVALLVIIFVMGPSITRLSLVAYLVHPETWMALLRNITLVSPQYTLPGVFQDNPYPEVQGSIWTLIHEVACYGGVVLVGLVGLLRRRALFTFALIVYCAAWLLPDLTSVRLPGRLQGLRDLSLAFVVGMTFYVWRERIILSRVVVVILIVLAGVASDSFLRTPALVFAVAYTTFWIAYVPQGVIRSYNKLGDYSYGTYLYAFPLQGLIVSLFGSQGPVMNICLALPITIGAAIISWHLVEKPALSLRRRRPIEHARIV